MEFDDRDEQGIRVLVEQGLCQRIAVKTLDWFEMITKSGLGLQGTQWPAYIQMRLCYL